METYLLWVNSWVVCRLSTPALANSKMARKGSRGQYDYPFLARDYRGRITCSGFS